MDDTFRFMGEAVSMSALVRYYRSMAHATLSGWSRLPLSFIRMRLHVAIETYRAQRQPERIAA